MKNFLSCVVLLLLMPLLFVIFWNGNKAVWGEDKALDTAVSVMLYQSDPQSRNIEALKAKAIVFRSALEKYSAAEWEKLLQAAVSITQEKEYRDRMVLYRQAVEETAQVYATVNGERAVLSYHAVSAGKTRDGHAESSWDRDAPGYMQVFSFTEDYIRHRLFSENVGADAAIHIKTVQKDEADYVQYVQTEQSTFSGEKIRNLLGLSSSCFTIKKEGGRFVFTCYGIGHGYGMSLYGCEILAGQGKSCQEILKYYYPHYVFSF